MPVDAIVLFGRTTATNPDKTTAGRCASADDGRTTAGRLAVDALGCVCVGRDHP